MEQNIEAAVTLDEEILEEVKFYTKDAFSEVVQSFFTSHAEHMSVIQQSVERGESVDFSGNAHALKSIGGQLGGMKFSLIAAELEEESKPAAEKATDLEKVGALYAALKQESEKLVEKLQAHIA